MPSKPLHISKFKLKLKLISCMYIFSTDPDFLETKEEITKSTELLAFARLWRNCKMIFRKKSKKQTKKDFFIKNFFDQSPYVLACLSRNF